MKQVLVVGNGRIGSAMLSRWYVASENTKFEVVNSKEIYPKNFNPDIVVIAVKPNQLAGVLNKLKELYNTIPVYLSVVAGVPVDFYKDILGKDAQIIRASVNTPAQIGKGVTVLYRGPDITFDSGLKVKFLMQLLGDVIWVKDELKMDLMTAISGCGPAYFFYIMKCLIKDAVDCGISEQDAITMVVNTCIGAGMLAKNSGKGLDNLIADVASPGGGTETALKIFNNDDALQKMITVAVVAAMVKMSDNQ